MRNARALLVRACLRGLWGWSSLLLRLSLFIYWRFCKHTAVYEHVWRCLVLTPGFVVVRFCYKLSGLCATRYLLKKYRSLGYAGQVRCRPCALFVAAMVINDWVASLKIGKDSKMQCVFLLLCAVQLLRKHCLVNLQSLNYSLQRNDW